jgi:hypothetical protein
MVQGVVFHHSKGVTTYSGLSMTAGAFPFLVGLAGADGFVEGAPTLGTFCLLDLRSVDPDNALALGDVLSLLMLAEAFRFLIDEVELLLSAAAEAAPSDASAPGAVEAGGGLAAWLAACRAEDLVILEDMSDSRRQYPWGGNDVWENFGEEVGNQINVKPHRAAVTKVGPAAFEGRCRWEGGSRAGSCR